MYRYRIISKEKFTCFYLLLLLVGAVSIVSLVLGIVNFTQPKAIIAEDIDIGFITDTCIPTYQPNIPCSTMYFNWTFFCHDTGNVFVCKPPGGWENVTSLSGTTGPTGGTGATGSLGGTGTSGTSGGTGTSGTSGGTGTSGTSGGTGASGISGTSGTSGGTGTSGTSGGTGTSGTSGGTGTSGTSGGTGTSGTSGGTGTSGTTGGTGTTGRTGGTGATGRTGTSGETGATGATGGNLPEVTVTIAGQGDNTLGYSINGVDFFPAEATCFSVAGHGTAYSPYLRLWVAVGEGDNTLCNSLDGKNWFKIPNDFFVIGYKVAWSETDGLFIAVGRRNTHTVISSSDGYNWFGIVDDMSQNIFDTTGTDVLYEQGKWVLTGCCNYHVAVTENRGLIWNRNLVFDTQALSVAYNPNAPLWLLTGQGSNTIATSPDTLIWTVFPLFNSIGYASAFGNDELLSANGIWTIAGDESSGLGSVYSLDLVTFFNNRQVNTNFNTLYAIAYNHFTRRWYYGGGDPSPPVLAYSTDSGVSVTDLGGSIFSLRTNHFAFTSESQTIAKKKKRETIVETCQRLCDNSGALKDKCVVSCIKKLGVVL